MKLKNKETGEIGYLIAGRGSDCYIVANDEWKSCGEYNSIAELNEEWEDVPEEPKAYYFIRDDDSGVGYSPIGNSSVAKRREQIGNYFETKEEAEKAAEKLKAWKRLKDKGFKITFVRDGGYVYLQADWGLLLGDFSDVELLFGGED